MRTFSGKQSEHPKAPQSRGQNGSPTNSRVTPQRSAAQPSRRIRSPAREQERLPTISVCPAIVKPALLSIVSPALAYLKGRLRSLAGCGKKGAQASQRSVSRRKRPSGVWASRPQKGARRPRPDRFTIQEIPGA